MNVDRLRWGVRATLALGVAASVVANILHAPPNPISQTIAAWPPLALLLTVELIARVPVTSRALSAARLIATTTIAGIAAWVSYWHMAGVASRYGETGASPYLIPLSVDGLIVVASICLVELSGQAPDKPADKQPATAPANEPATPDKEQAARTGGPVFDHLFPIGPMPPPADKKADKVPDRKPPRRRTLTPAERVVRAHRQNPTATHRELAELADVSVRTVERNRPPRPTNGNVPQLAKTP
jgi:hypothetical protein